MLETKKIGNKISNARKKQNISQAQLAELLFISPQAVGKWERGESMPDITTFNRLAVILGVDLNYFSDNKPLEDDEKIGITGHAAKQKDPVERQLLTNFSGSNLPTSDFTGVTAHKRKFKGSAMRGTDFSGADLTGSSFTGSDLSKTNFSRTNLTDCKLTANNLSDAEFKETILIRTEFNSSDLTGAKFSNAAFMDARIIATDLRKTIFESCSFKGVDMKSCDMSGLCLDKQAFTDVRFDKVNLKDATFKGAIFKNVSFYPAFALTNKYYRAIKTICFDGATMDKLTYAALKGMGANLSEVKTK